MRLRGLVAVTLLVAGVAFSAACGASSNEASGGDASVDDAAARDAAVPDDAESDDVTHAALDATRRSDVVVQGGEDAGDSDAACTLATGRLHLAWDPSPEANVVGYKVYWGTTSLQYTDNADVGLTATPTAPSYLLTGLTCGRTYFIAVTAYNDALLESTYSNEASAQPNCSCTDGGTASDASDDGG